MIHYKDWVVHGMLSLPRYVNSTAPRYPAQLTAQTIAGGTLPVGDYYYKVTGVDSSGDANPWISNEASATTTPGNQQISLLWDGVPDLSPSSTVYRGTSSGGQNLQLAVAGSTNITDTGGLGWSAGSPAGGEYTHKVMRDIALGGATFVCMTGTIAENTDITGFAGGVDGRLLILYFENVSQVTLRQESVWSAAANRIFTLRHQACTANWHVNKQIRWMPDITFSGANGFTLDGKTIHVFIWHPNIISGSGRWIHLFSNGNNLG